MNSRQRFESAIAGKPVDRPPIWFMRQAGRYLPEYMELRKGKTFENMVMDVDTIAQITLQPIERFDLDAAIIFSDILIPLYSMERGLEIKPGIGPVLEKPIKEPNEIERLPIPDPDNDFPYVAESIRVVRKSIPKKWLIGFAGAPFTLASYLLEGQSTRNALLTKKFAFMYPEPFAMLLDKLTEIVIEQLKTQIEAGVDMVQLFDSWGGFLSPIQYETWILPHMKKIVDTIKEVPVFVYSRQSSHMLPILRKTNATGYSIDNSLTLCQAREIVGKDKVLQGNMEPAVLLTDTKALDKELRVLKEDVTKQGSSRYVFNLAQGINKDSSVEVVSHMVDALKQWRIAK